MARTKATGPTLPEWQRSQSIKGRVYFRVQGPTLIAQAWPKARGTPKSPTTKTQNNLFAATVKAVRDVDPSQIYAARTIAEGTAYTWRDVLFMAMHGDWVDIGGLSEMDLQQQLDLISDQPGAMLYRGPDMWVALLPPSENAVMAFDLATHMPFWTLPTDTGITELTGDVIAGPGSGSQAAALTETGVEPGVYLNANIEVDAKGRITAAEDGASDTGITELTGDVTAGPGSGSQAATLSDTGVAAGAYHHASITVDGKGRITAAAPGPVATSADAGIVRPDNSTITIDASGVITATGAAPGGPGTGLYAGLMYPVPTISGLNLGNWRNQGSTSVSNKSQGVEIIPRNDAGIDIWAWYYGTPPTLPYTISALVCMTPITSSDHGFAIGHSDGTKLELLRLYQQNGGTAVILSRYNNTTSWNSNPASTNTGGMQMYGLRMVVSSANVEYWISADGESWSKLTTVTKSGSFLGATGYSELGLGFQYSGASPAAFKLLGYKVS